jgi:hypothetical protein
MFGKRNWPELVALTSIFSVELPGIEPASLPGLLPSELQFRYVSFPFSTVRYLRFHFRVLTASRGQLYCGDVHLHHRSIAIDIVELATQHDGVGIRDDYASVANRRY